jgi:hypothetical protein
MATMNSFTPICPVCNLPVSLELSKADERGKAIHEECYLLKIHLHDGTLPPKDS